MLPFRPASILLGTVAAFSLTMPALAADIVIEQVGVRNALGTWTLFGPTGGVTHGSTTLRTIPLTESGTYTLTVVPPADASVMLELRDASGRPIVNANRPSITATLLPETSYRFVVEYEYNTTISIRSDPSGAPVDVEDMNGRVVRSGTTPVSFSMPAGTYTAKYGYMDNCALPKPQRRTAGIYETVEFFGRYLCTVPGRPPVTPPSPPSQPETPRDATGRVSLSLTPHQREVLAGGIVHYTLNVRNQGRTTQHDLVVRFNFNPETMVLGDTPGGVVDRDTVTWNIPELFAGQSWNVNVPVQIRSGADTGNRFEVSAVVTGPEINEAISPNLRQTVVVGTPVIPATGLPLDRMFLATGAGLALFLTSRSRHRQSVAITA
jgi:hypothetical protein